MRRRAWAHARAPYETGLEIGDRPHLFRKPTPAAPSARCPLNRGPKSVKPWAALRAIVVLIYLFMLGPIVITAAVSFNQSNRSQFPPRGFSLQWWQRAVSTEWVDPLIFSLKLALLAALISTLLALPLAFALARHRF